MSLLRLSHHCQTLAAAGLVAVLSLGCSIALGMQIVESGELSEREYVPGEHFADADEDFGAVLDAIREFDMSPSPENTRITLQFLQAALDDLDRYPPTIVDYALASIGNQPVPGAESLMVRFLRLPNEPVFSSHAANALAEIGGELAFEHLLRIANDANPLLLASTAQALGRLNCRAAAGRLRDLSRHPEADVRSCAVSALARCCANFSVEVAFESLQEETDNSVRTSLAYWLRQCAEDDDADLLVELLQSERPVQQEPIPLVRFHALNGLIRLQSKAACGLIDELVADSDLNLRIAAKNYTGICSCDPTRADQAAPPQRED